jgi:predicted Fe-S protein YdhL (DUF1289 family)
MSFEFSRQIFEKYRNIRFNENPSSESQVVYAGGQTYENDEPTVAFCNFANGPTNGCYSMFWERVDWIDLAQDRKRSVMINVITLYCTIILERLRKAMLKPSKGGGCITTGFE